MSDDRLRQILLFITMLLFAASAAAGVYKWVDEDGHVQFGDRPPPEVDAGDEVVIRNKEPASEEIAPVDRKQVRDRLLEQYQREREEKKETSAKKRKEKEQQEKRCAYAKTKLSEYLEHGAIYDRLPNQERRYLTDQERDAEIAQARKEVKMWCK